MFKSKISIIGFSALNAVLMTVFTFLWLNNSYILTDDEEYMIKTTSGLRSTYFKLKEKPNPEDFLFIDIAWEKQLVNEYNEEGQIIGKRPITNRKRIAEFLSYVNQTNKHKFIILDVFFKDSSDYASDSDLQKAFSKTKNILIPYHMDEHGKPDMPIFNAPVALSDYDKDDIDNNFVKFKCLYGDSVRTTPLVMYEMLHGDKFTDHDIYGSFKGNLALSSFILDLRIWNQNLNRITEKTNLSDTSETVKYEILYLSDVLYDAINPSLLKPESEFTEEDKAKKLMMPNILQEEIPQHIDNKIVVIGDFSDSDIHETIYGATPGPLILLNVYLALRDGDNLFNVWFILFLLGGFYFISYNCFKGKDIFATYIKRLTKRVKKLNRASFFLNFMSYILYFILLSVLSFFLFNIHITILLLALYMEVLEKLVQYIRKKNGLVETEDAVN